MVTERTVEGVQAAIDWCKYVDGCGGCTPCETQEWLISVACGWAWDQGAL